MTRGAPRRPAWQWTTLLLSIALAATLGATVYFATSSLPFLATSPTTDPTFGALNACLHGAVPSRTGFAVSRDARAAAAWSTNLVARCSLDTDTTRLETFPVAGVTVGAFDETGTLWVVSQPGGLTSTLLRLAPTGTTSHGETGALAIAGTATGVVVLEADRLVSLSSAGEALAVTTVDSARRAGLAVSADGARVAVTGLGVVLVYDVKTLTRARLETPCEVRDWWWLKEGQRALLGCAGDDLALLFDTERGAHDAATPQARVPSVLAGPGGPWVVACDVLPCTAPEPVSVR